MRNPRFLVSVVMLAALAPLARAQARMPGADQLRKWEQRYHAPAATSDEKKLLLRDAYAEVFETRDGMQWFVESLVLRESDLVLLEEGAKYLVSPQVPGFREYLFELTANLSSDRWLAKTALMGAVATYQGALAAVIQPLLQRNKDVRVLIRAVELLGRYADVDQGESLPMLRDLLGDSQWQVRTAAVRALRALGRRADERRMAGIAQTLYDTLGNTRTGSLRGELVAALGDLLRLSPEERRRGARDPELFDAWLTREYWETRLAHELSPERRRRPFVAPAVARAKEELPRPFGVPLLSDRVLFLVDGSESMQAALAPPAWAAVLSQLPHLAARRARPATLADLVREELAHALERLPRQAAFTLAFFADEVQYWSHALERAGDAGRQSALRAAQRQPPGQLTALEEALFSAFRFCRHGGRPVPDFYHATHYREGPDTVMVITDGYNTVGRWVTATERPELVKALAEVNRFRLLTFHTVALPGADLRLLRELAENSGGQFVRLGEG